MTVIITYTHIFGSPYFYHYSNDNNNTFLLCDPLKNNINRVFISKNY